MESYVKYNSFNIFYRRCVGYTGVGTTEAFKFIREQLSS